MAREYGKRYSKSTLSGYKNEQEARDYFSRSYPFVPVEVVREDPDYVFYFEDPNGELYAYKREELKGILAYTEDEVVSTDTLGSAPSIFDRKG